MARSWSKLTPERSEAVLRAIRQGMSLRQAAAATGISHTTITRWAARSVRFRDALMQAEAQFIQVCIAGILKQGLKGMPGSWQALAWLLERRYPDQYGRNARLDVKLELRKAAQQIAGDDPSLDEDALLALAEEIYRTQMGQS